MQNKLDFDLDEIRARCEAAKEDLDFILNPGTDVQIRKIRKDQFDARSGSHIVALLSDIDALLAEVQRLQAVRKEVEILNSRVDAQKRIFERAYCWIPANKQIPPEDTNILIYDGKGTYISHSNLLFRLAEDGELYVPGKYGMGIKITHWMPLPAPPDKEAANAPNQP